MTSTLEAPPMKSASGPMLNRMSYLISRGTSPRVVMGILYTCLVKHRFLSCGTGLRLGIPTTILGHGSISIGKNFVSMGWLYLYAHNGGSLKIGDNCSVNTNVQLGAAHGTIIIGDNVIIA